MLLMLLRATKRVEDRFARREMKGMAKQDMKGKQKEMPGTSSHLIARPPPW